MMEYSSSSSNMLGEELPEIERNRILRMRSNRAFFEANGFDDPYPGIDLGDSKEKTQKVTSVTSNIYLDWTWK